MTPRVYFRCVCGTRFSVETHRLAAGKEVRCPNCGKTFPREKSQRLGKALLTVMEILETSRQTNEWGEPQGFVILLEDQHG